MADLRKIRLILSQINDPVISGDIATSGRIADLRFENEQIIMDLKSDGLQSSHRFQLMEQIQTSLIENGIKQEPHIRFLDAKSSKGAVKPPIPVKYVIAVASGKGGVGKSTVSVNLAITLRNMGAKTGIMDADLYGPSIPTMLGVKDKKPKVVKQGSAQKILPVIAYDIPTISIGYIVKPEQAVVLRGPRLSGIIRQFFHECLWPKLDYLIIDLPPGTGDIQLTMLSAADVNSALIVTTPQEVAISDALKAANMFLLPNVDVPLAGIVENMSWFTPTDQPAKKYKLFGSGGGEKLSNITGSPLLAQIPLTEGMVDQADKGIPAVMDDNEIISRAYKKLATSLYRLHPIE